MQYPARKYCFPCKADSRFSSKAALFGPLQEGRLCSRFHARGALCSHSARATGNTARVPGEEQRHETLVDQLEAVVEALASNDRAVAERAIEPISFTPGEPASPRRYPSKRVEAEVFWRDSFTCRYCRSRTIDRGVLSLISGVFPKEFPEAGSRALDHPAYWTIYATVDHVNPGSRGGDWLDPKNLATACRLCQYQKKDHLLSELHRELLAPVAAGWDGLVRSYRRLWEACGEPFSEYHQSRLTALEESDPTRPGP